MAVGKGEFGWELGYGRPREKGGFFKVSGSPVLLNAKERVIRGRQEIQSVFPRVRQYPWKRRKMAWPVGDGAKECIVQF